MGIRSNFLVHWTGKDIQTDINALSNEQRKEYIHRLIDILKNGLWMTIPSEVIIGKGGSNIIYFGPMTCFTEVRLSQASNHAEKYGLLGIGVNRQFVLERNGGPVHYVRNHNDDEFILNVTKIMEIIEPYSSISDTKNRMAFNISFLKMMSKINTDDFSFLDENEWRIVHSGYQEEVTKRIIKTSEKEPEYRIPLTPMDVRVIVFPDNKTLSLANKEKVLINWMKDANEPPTLITLRECGEI